MRFRVIEVFINSALLSIPPLSGERNLAYLCDLLISLLCADLMDLTIIHTHTHTHTEDGYIYFVP